ncbi:uncharacterized protein LOC122134985 isoform X2 [Cyprinus carpio]|uniref:Uncharacterized protein LOC122134985 isoform X2 n=1 Tax=Cyprinus carpio TaxID=7962 RepID=A0A9Q9VNK6_CYPCA|nr:uncharacterized protein LOC122134985 isoform X2 [Cyprinus carpio]
MLQKNRQDRIMWYFNENRIAYITGEQTKICTDPECPETFRGRLKLDTQTVSLTITNINTTDSGGYHLQINSRNLEKTFNVTVHDAPAAGRDEMKSVQEGESVTLDPGSDFVFSYFSRNMCCCSYSAPGCSCWCDLLS